MGKDDYYTKIDSEALETNPYWEYKRDHYSKKDGAVAEYYYYNKTSGSVMVVPILRDGRLVLINQYRYLGGKLSLEFPAGGVGKDEVPGEAAKRELEEETGIAADDLMKVSEFEPDAGVGKNRIHVFLATDLEEGGTPKTEEFENIEIILRRPDEFEEMIRRGEIWDGPTLSAWALVRGFVMQRFSTP